MTAKKKPEKEEKTEKLCFVVGPIGDEGSETRIKANWLLKAIIKPVLEPRGYIVKRADEMPVPGNIDTQVINTVIDAQLVVADLSELNANAFYELGLRHMSPNKPVIHMKRKGERIPFDNTAFRTIDYDLVEFETIEKAKVILISFIDEIEKDGFKVETPVSRARAVKEVRFEGTEVEKILQSQVSVLANEVAGLKRQKKLGVSSQDFEGNAPFTVDAGMFSKGFLDLNLFEIRTFEQLTDEIYFRLRPDVPAYTYGSTWGVKALGHAQIIKSMRMLEGLPAGHRVKDSRPLSVVGIGPGSYLEVIRL